MDSILLSNLKGYYSIEGDLGPTYVTAKELMCINLIHAERTNDPHPYIPILSLSLKMEDYVLRAVERTKLSTHDIIRLARQGDFIREDNDCD